MKRFLALFIALLTFATFFAFSAAADDGDVYYYVDQGAGDDRKNSGKTPEEAVSTFNRAILNAKKEGANRAIIVIMAPYTVRGHVKVVDHADFPVVMTSHDGKTDYRKENGAIIHLGSSNRYYLGGETTFENISFDFQATILFGAQYYPITMGEGVVLTCTDTKGYDAVGVGDAGAHIAGGYIYPSGDFPTDRDSHVTIKSGEFNRVYGGTYRWDDGETGGVTFTGTNHINIEGGQITDLYGGSGMNHISDSTVININGGKIGRLFTGGDEIRRILHNATVNLNGGEVGEVNVNNVIGDAVVNLAGTKVSSMRAYFYSEKLHKEHRTWGKRTLNYDSSEYTAEQAEAFTNGFDKLVDIKNPDAESKKFEKFGKLISVAPENVYFVADDGTGTGKSVTEPTNSLSKAFIALKENGGTIVVVGKCTVDKELILRAWNGKITLTSVYGGVDFQKENRAELALRQNVTLGGELELCDITVAAENRTPVIYAYGYPLTLGDGITSKIHELTMTYVSVYGGYKAERDGAVTSITVNSGIWQDVYGGGAGDDKNLTSNIVINGGEIWGPVVAGGNGSHNGSGRITVNGGKLYQGIFSSRLDKKGETSDMNTVITVNGGTVYATIAPDVENIGTYNGTFEVNLVGGEYGHLVSLNGGADYTGNLTAKLNVDKSIDINAKEEGDVTFKNPILQDGADPWLFYYNGLYHITATIGDGGIGLATAANLGDIYNAEFRLFYTPPENDPWMKNHWSPEIHYYTDEQIGEGNGGWYCYFCCDGEGEGQHFRAMVIKCLDGDNFYGDWGHPLTGEVNVPMLVDAVDIPEVANTFHGGQTDVIIDGEVYAFFTTLIGYHTKGDGLKQVELIAKMPNPWTLQGPAGIISIPTYDWEKHGSIWDVRSEVNEGGTAVYGDDGSVFMVFSGSYYDGPEYKLGQIKYLGGDPLDIGNWEKKDTPILDKSEEITGCGHASYSVDHEGNNWICYHAYVTGDTTMKGYGGGRRAFVEQYTANKDGVVIGNGSGHPAPLDTEYTMSINPMPLAEKISGFDKTGSYEAPATEIRMTLNSLTATVNGAPKTLDAAPVIKNSRTMLPVRFVAENLGATVGWDDATKTVSIKSAEVTIEIVIGATVAKVNGKEITLDSPAYIEPQNNRTYLPVRAVAENLGAKVNWDDATKTAILTK